MIGNDIVDLGTAAIESNWQRPGFLQKLFCKNEQEFIFNAVEPSQQVWLLWSMKEAAYKAHQRKNNTKRSFNPVKIRCLKNAIKGANASGIVRIGENHYYLKSRLNNKYIHSVATLSEKENYISKVYPASVTLKEQLIKKISEIEHLSEENILITKNLQSVPIATWNEQVINRPFSLSHHGNFSAYSVALMNY